MAAVLGDPREIQAAVANFQPPSEAAVRSFLFPFYFFFTSLPLSDPLFSFSRGINGLERKEFPSRFARGTGAEPFFFFLFSSRGEHALGEIRGLVSVSQRRRIASLAIGSRTITSDRTSVRHNSSISFHFELSSVEMILSLHLNILVNRGNVCNFGRERAFVLDLSGSDLSVNFSDFY